MEKKVYHWGYKRLGTEQWYLSTDSSICLGYEDTVYSNDWVKLNYKIGKKFEEQRYSNFIAYKLTKRVLI